MGFWSKTTKLMGHIVDLRVDRWLDLETIKHSSAYFGSRIRHLFRIKVSTHPESFEEATQRLDLNAQELAKQAKRYLLASYIFVGVAFCFFIYAGILAYLGSWMGTCMAFCLMLYAVSVAFRFHFWHFQITQQKLGCTLQDYRAQWFKTQLKKGTPLA